MAYVNIKEKSDLVNIRKKLQKRFLNEKLGEQDIYQEDIKRLQPLIEPIKDIATHQKEILQSQSAIPLITTSRTPLAIEDVPASPSIPGYNLGKISEKYLKGIFSHNKYDKAFGIKATEGSTDFKLGNKIFKIDGNNLIIEGQDSEGIYKVPDGKIILSKIVWRIPHVMVTDKYMIKLSNDIQNKIVLNVNFLNRQCESVEVNQGQKQFDWRLNVTAGSEKPRFIILDFQENKDDNQVVNPAIFDHCNLTNACVRLNSERYPEMDLQLDFNENHFTTAYKMLSDYFNHIIYKGKNCSITLLEYRNLYPLLVFDVSKQSEKLKNSVTYIKITASFQKNISKPTKAYALVLSERILKLESDGNKMNIVY